MDLYCLSTKELLQLSHIPVRNPLSLFTKKMYREIELKAFAMKKYGNEAGLASEWKRRRELRAACARRAAGKGKHPAENAINKDSTPQYAQQVRKVAPHHRNSDAVVLQKPSAALITKLKKSESLVSAADRVGLTPAYVAAAILGNKTEALKQAVKQRLATGRKAVPGRMIQLAQDLGVAGVYTNNLSFYAACRRVLPFPMTTAVVLHFDHGVKLDKLREITTPQQAESTLKALQAQKAPGVTNVGVSKSIIASLPSAPSLLSSIKVLAPIRKTPPPTMSEREMLVIQMKRLQAAMAVLARKVEAFDTRRTGIV